MASEESQQYMIVLTLLPFGIMLSHQHLITFLQSTRAAFWGKIEGRKSKKSNQGRFELKVGRNSFVSN